MYREVSTEEGEKKALELGVMFIEVSAKSGYNIKTVSVATSVGWPIVFSAVLHYSPRSVLQYVYHCVLVLDGGCHQHSANYQYPM